jgi:hypothetical protein
MPFFKNMFGENKKIHAPQELISSIDALLQMVYISGYSLSCRQKVESIRRNLTNVKYSRITLHNVQSCVTQLLERNISESHIVLVCQKISLYLSDVMPNEIELQNIDNQIKISELSDSVQTIADRIKATDKEMQVALKERNKVQWNTLRIEKDALDKQLVILSSTFNNLMQAQANIEIQHVSEQSLKNDAYILKQCRADVDKIRDAAVEDETITRSIQKDTQIIDELFELREAPTDFDIAYEQYVNEQLNKQGLADTQSNGEREGDK